MSGKLDDSSCPEGWINIPLSQIAEINPRHAKELDVSINVTFAPMAVLSENSSEFSFYEERPISEVRKGYTHFAEGDVLMAKITPCMENGKAAIARNLLNGLGCGTTELHVFRPSEAILADYLYRFIHQESVRREAAAHFSGSAGQLRVPTEFVSNLEIPLPPPAEQLRIVEQVEALLARVREARRRLTRIPQLLKRFRQAVLAAACDGRLTADWREINSLESCTATVEQIAHDHALKIPVIDAESEPTEGWVRVSLGFLAQPILGNRPYITSGSRGWSKLVGKEGPYFIRSENINTNQLRLIDAVRVAAPDGSEAKRTRVAAGDLLLTITGNNVGRTAVVPLDCPAAHVSQHVAIIRMHPNVLSKYIWLWLRSKEHGQKQLNGYFYGETKPGLNLEQVKSIWVDLPPPTEQFEIVRRVDDLFKQADAIERRIRLATARADKLTQAILAKAFRGELVPPEAEIARAEGRKYETAAELLARITKPNAPSKASASRKRRGQKDKIGFVANQ